MSGESRTPASAPRLARGGASVLSALVLLAIVFGIAPGTGRSGFEAGTLALAVVGALAGAAALVGVRRQDHRVARIARELHELAEKQRFVFADAAGRRPEPRVLFLFEGNEGVQRARIERRRPRPLE